MLSKLNLFKLDMTCVCVMLMNHFSFLVYFIIMFCFLDDDWSRILMEIGKLFLQLAKEKNGAKDLSSFFYLFLMDNSFLFIIFHFITSQITTKTLRKVQVLFCCSVEKFFHNDKVCKSFSSNDINLNVFYYIANYRK